MAVHQLLSYARRGDAVTNQALALRDELSHGGRSRIVAHVVDPSVADDVEPVSITDLPADDLVLYHVTIGCAPAVEWITQRRRYGLVYHNITPPELFLGLSPEHERLCTQGREELARLAPASSVTIADSRFNAAEVEALGGRVDAVHPPITTAYRLGRAAETRATASPPRLLYVGQVAPHKGVHELVLAHHLAQTVLGSPATLVLAGAHPVPLYSEVIEETIEMLGVEGIEITGQVSDQQLEAAMRSCRALVTASRHEGFCVPIVEAMALGTPVLALGSGAIPETAAGAALVLSDDATPTVLAEAMMRLVSDDSLCEELGRRGVARAAEIDEAASTERLRRVLAPLG